MSASLDPDWITVVEAAQILGCHVETVRLLIRRRRLYAERGPHGRYYIPVHELALISVRHRARSDVSAGLLDAVNERLDVWLAIPSALMAWQRPLVEGIRHDPAADLALYRAIAVQLMKRARANTVEVANALGISVRQVRRLWPLDVATALSLAHARRQRDARGRGRREAAQLVKDIQARLAAAGFRAARRDRRRRLSGARAGVTARVAIVRDLRRDQVRALLNAGLDERQVAAISLLGIGADEYHELAWHGLPVQRSAAH